MKLLKYYKILILLLTVCFAAVAVRFGIYEQSMQNFPFSVMAYFEGGTEEIPCVEIYGEYYVFIPGHADPAQVSVHANAVYDIYIEDRLLTEGLSCDVFPLDTKLELFYYTAEGDPDGIVTFLRSDNVPLVFLDVASGSMIHIHEEKGNEEPGHVRIYTEDGVLDYAGELESIKGRGNATWLGNKKPYSLKLRKEADLLDMGEAQKWILLANAMDMSNIRNKLAYDLAAKTGLPYSPECKWVDLYLNGEYAGLYLLSERNEIHPNRVALESDGALVSMELEFRLIDQSYPYIRSDRGTILRIHQSSISEEELRQRWESAENAIFSESGVDPVSGKTWTELIDLDSWAKKYLLEEVLGNYDAGSVSQYFYYDAKDGKIYAGPVWDMDNSMGSGEWINRPNTIQAGRQHMWNDQDSPLYYALLQKDVFLERVLELYYQIYRPAVTELCRTGIDGYILQISQSQELNRARWPDTARCSDGEEIRCYLLQRLAFLDAFWGNREEFVTVHAWIPGKIWGCWGIRPGENMEHLDSDGKTVWYDLETGELFDVTAPVYRDTVLKRGQIPETGEDCV